MNKTMAFLFAIAIAGFLGTAEAAFLDVQKSDYIIGADSKDSRSLMVGISVEWQSNISATSQNSANVRSMASMATIEEIREYTFNDLEINKPLIENNIKSDIINKARNIDISISDVKITKIIEKNSEPATKPQIIYVSRIPIWAYIVMLVAFAIGYVVGAGNKKKE